MARLRRVLLASAVLLVPAVAAAQPGPVADKATGLAVSPPPGYVASPATPRTGQAALFDVKTPADTDTGCHVAFSPAPANNRFRQPELDATIRGAQWQETARSTLANVYDIADSSVVDVNGHPAFVVAADFRDRPGLPARARDVRTLMVIRETPRGRTSTVCVGERAGWDARRAGFMAVANGVTAP